LLQCIRAFVSTTSSRPDSRGVTNTEYTLILISSTPYGHF
jgi:hypothetical protein